MTKEAWARGRKKGIVQGTLEGIKTILLSNLACFAECLALLGNAERGIICFLSEMSSSRGGYSPFDLSSPAQEQKH